jgi:hypothetical protein
MAMADYYLCDVCGCKCFYDSNLNWEWGTKDDPIPDDEKVRGTELRLDSCGDIGALCRTCAKTHEVVVRKIEPAAQSADSRDARIKELEDALKAIDSLRGPFMPDSAIAAVWAKVDAALAQQAGKEQQ